MELTMPRTLDRPGQRVDRAHQPRSSVDVGVDVVLTWREIGPTYRGTTSKARAREAAGDQGRCELTDERPAEVDGALLCHEASIDGYEELTGFVMEDFADVLAEFVNYEGYTQEEAVAFLKRFDKRALTNTLLAASRWREIFADFIREELDR
jgi:hypothetical protein